MLAAGTLAGTAHAGGKVAVLNVEGDQSGQVEDALTSIVEDEHEVVSSQTFDEVAEKAGVKALDTKGIAKVAKRLAVAAVVEGVMTRDEQGYDLTVRIRAQSGKTTKKVEVAMASKKLSAKDRRSLGAQVLEALDEIDPRSGRARRDENLDREDKSAKKRAHTGKLQSDDDEAAADDGDDADAAPKARKEKKHAKAKAKPKADDDEAAADDAGASDDGELAMRAKPKHKASKAKPRLAVKDDGDDADAAEPPADPAPMRKSKHNAQAGGDEVAMLHDDDGAMRGDDEDARPPRGRDDEAAPSDDEEGVTAHARRHHDAPKIQAAVIDAGLSVTGRQLTFTSRAFAQAPHGYKGPFAPGGHVDGAIYPLALSDRSSAAAGLGFDFEYDQTTSLTTRTSEAMSVVMPTSEDHWAIGGRYRFAIGSGGTQLAVGFDYSHRQFVVDRSGLPPGASLDLPDVVYKAYAPEVAARIPLGPRVTLTANGRVLLIKSAGAIQTQAEYGAAKVTGGEGAAGLEILVSSNVVLNVSGTAAIIGYAFTGNGLMSANRDGDPTTKDVGGAMDQYIGGMATLGIAY
jgi:hypothetical protein